MVNIAVIGTGGTIASVEKTGGARDIEIRAHEAMLDLIPSADKRLLADRGINLIPYHLIGIESTNMNPTLQKYLGYATLTALQNGADKIIILHGTDTMALTSSALSFMFPNIGTSVILTGSQRSSNSSNTDARRNLLSAIDFSMECGPGVHVAFNGHLFRGTACEKEDEISLDAFKSKDPAFPEGIATETGAGITHFASRESRLSKVPYFLPFAKPGIVPLIVHAGMPPQVLTYNMRSEGVSGIVLQSRGAGNIPTDWLEFLLNEKEADLCDKVLAVAPMHYGGEIVTDIQYGAVSVTSLIMKRPDVVGLTGAAISASLAKFAFVTDLVDHLWHAAKEVEAKYQRLPTLKHFLTTPMVGEFTSVSDLLRMQQTDSLTKGAMPYKPPYLRAEQLEALLPLEITISESKTTLHPKSELAKFADYVRSYGVSGAG